METGEIYIFTIRNANLKNSPRIIQQRIYIKPYYFKLALCYEKLIYNEEEKGEKTNKNKLNFLKELLFDIVKDNKRHEYFSNNSFYFECINKYIETKEGWCNTKKL